MIDPVMIAAAREQAIEELFANGVIGGEENAAIINDGSGEKTDFYGLLGEGVTYIKVSAEPIELSSVSKVVFREKIIVDVEHTATKESLVLEKGEETEMLAASGLEYYLVVSFFVDINEDGAFIAKGTYVLDSEQDNKYIKVLSFDYTKAVSTMNPKYLPGVCMPIVDMSDVLIYTEGTANITLTAEHLARLGMDGNPKFILCDFYGGLKVAALILPMFEESLNVGYGGIAVIESAVFGIHIVIDGNGGGVAAIRGTTSA